jgi:outer membrane biosynthesis protein TonB
MSTEMKPFSVLLSNGQRIGVLATSGHRALDAAAEQAMAKYGKHVTVKSVSTPVLAR